MGAAVIVVGAAVIVVGAAVIVVGAAVVGAATSPLEAHPVRRATVSSQAGRRESTGSV